MGAGASAADEGAIPPGPAGDPWASKSGAEALQLIREEEGEPVTVEEAEGLLIRRKMEPLKESPRSPESPCCTWILESLTPAEAP